MEPEEEMRRIRADIIYMAWHATGMPVDMGDLKRLQRAMQRWIMKERYKLPPKEMLVVKSPDYLENEPF